MATPETQPSTPAEWREYANSVRLAQIPTTYSFSEDRSAEIYSLRDVLIDASSTFLGSKASSVSVFADVLVFSGEETVIKIPDCGVFMLYTRVITASSPIRLVLKPETKSDCVVMIYASVLDQPVSYTYKLHDPVNVALGSGSQNVGIALEMEHGKIKESYMSSYNDLDGHPKEFAENLRTQLRIASVFFWRQPAIAISLTSHVACATSQTESESLLNAQSLALGQQLAAQALTGPNMSYAPVLPVTSYMATLSDAIATASAFEEQYHRFQDRKLALEDRMAAWGTMLDHAEGATDMHRSLRQSAYEKYQNACDIVLNSNQQFRLDQITLDDKKLAFKIGIDEWKEKMKLEAAFKILTAIISKLFAHFPNSNTFHSQVICFNGILLGFAIAIGAICIGDGAASASAPAEAESAIQAVVEAESLTQSVGRILKSDTVKKLKNCVMMTAKLYSSMSKTVEQIKNLGNDPTGKTGDDDGQVDGDLNSLVAIASWDKWQLESDEQLEFAIEQKINGAAEYRLALRQHAINGKLLAQAHAQAIKAGQEYVQAELAYNLSQRDMESLKKLKEEYKDEEEQFRKAEAMFYDRLIALRTSVTIELRNLVWAYKFYALEDASINLDAQKPIEEYRVDELTIREKIDQANSRYAGDYQRKQWVSLLSVPAPDPSSLCGCMYVLTLLQSAFKFKVYPDELFLTGASSIVDSLKSNTHTASFTLVPSNPKIGSYKQDLSGPFIEGSHFRVHGLEVELVGARPRPTYLKRGTATVRIAISTSGIYSDIQDGQVFHFTSLPLQRIYAYEITEAGEKDDVVVHSTFPSTNHAEPPAFTQWTIRLKQPERLDLSGLTDVRLRWTGAANFAS
ncbi:hypothetical protein PRK78_001409 [Emydomyces testavorans]|uniref:Uncharacterized protein n=1 Tax=Emydomyces testavorans TaxID=2070801 RepID=A0AAF0DCH2_9EURO|nr:hypothetical protein PRK78_001409 [Emydomyces testavorans]